jgi:PUA domain protein
MKRKEFQTVLGLLRDLGWDLPEHESGEIVETEAFTLILIQGEPMIMLMEGRPFPTVRGLLRHPLSSRYVTVDMGAVRYIVNGADVMAPGIVEVADDVSRNEFVWVRDQDHGKPLCVGLALMDRKEMVGGRGRAVKNLHHVGDEIWNLF